MSQDEDAFIEKHRKEGNWGKALAAATLVVRGDTRFVGLDKIREPVIHAAALKGLGGDFPNRSISKLAVDSPWLEIDKLIDEAADAVKGAVNP